MLKTPKLSKIKNSDESIIAKVEGCIQDAMESICIQVYPLEDFDAVELGILGEYAKENDIFVSIKAEHSNFHQGVLIQLVKRDLVNKFIEYL